MRDETCCCDDCTGKTERDRLRAEVAQLRGLVRELLGALQEWADSKESPELDDLCERAKKAGAP